MSLAADSIGPLWQFRNRIWPFGRVDEIDPAFNTVAQILLF